MACSQEEVRGPPPDYASVVGGQGGPEWGPSNPIGPRGSEENPPDYSVAASLPSYEQSELQKDKMMAEETDIETGASREGERGVRDGVLDWEVGEEDLALLGNDFVFFTAFITSFLFNWIGFLLLMCFCHTIAARYGALAGFGLSLAKWTLIVQRSTDLVHEENAWLWWLVLGFGFLICVRACVQFRQIKRSWPHLSTQARERLFFFY